MNEPKMYRTKVILEVEVDHWGTTCPDGATRMLLTSLNYPAIHKVTVLEVASNHDKLGITPLPELTIR